MTNFIRCSYAGLGKNSTPLPVDSREGTDRAIRTFGVDSPPDGSLTATLATTGEPPLFLDLAAAGRDPSLDSWLSQPQRLRAVAAVFDPDRSQQGMRTEPVSFDGLCLLGQTTPTVGPDP